MKIIEPYTADTLVKNLNIGEEIYYLDTDKELYNLIIQEIILESKEPNEYLGCYTYICTCLDRKKSHLKQVELAYEENYGGFHLGWVLTEQAKRGYRTKHE